MTTWESIDNVDMENVTLTSDAAFARVTSDEHFEEEKNGGYLQQNTAWLIQEIPNISFLDVSDTMLESRKTLYERENWILRVWKAWRSIEVQPQDTVSLIMNGDYEIPEAWEHYVEFDDSISSLNYTVCKPEQTWNLYHIDILQTWYYVISYGREVMTNSATELKITISNDWHNPWTIMTDKHKATLLPEIMSWWKYIPNVYLEEWDVINMKIYSNSDLRIFRTTYLNIQFQQYTLWYSNI